MNQPCFAFFVFHFPEGVASVGFAREKKKLVNKLCTLQVGIVEKLWIRFVTFIESLPGVAWGLFS